LLHLSSADGHQNNLSYLASLMVMIQMTIKT